MSTEAARILRRRLERPARGWLDIDSTLRHFALINYALPAERLRPHIPERFEIPEREIDGRRLAFMSAVPFWDDDFHFLRLPMFRFGFAQTNYRVYVRDRVSGEDVVWFFGTTLGARVVHLARLLWRIPWHFARYRLDCTHDAATGRYTRFRYDTESSWAAARIELADTGAPAGPVPGFEAEDDRVLFLTHPVEGFFFRADGRVGTYSVWHEEIPMTRAEPVELWFSLYERLGLLSREEMMRPHSVWLCPSTLFWIRMPPRVSLTRLPPGPAAG